MNSIDLKIARRTFCFYLDIHDHGLSRAISRRLEELDLQQDLFLTPRVTHVVRSHSQPAAAAAAACPRRKRRSRADAMLQSVAPDHHHGYQQNAPALNYTTLTVQKVISLLDSLYESYYKAPRITHVKSKHFIKIEFLDKACRPVFREFDEWPVISVEPDPPKEKKENYASKNLSVSLQNNNNTIGQKMTRKSRPRIKEKQEKLMKGGYCEICNVDYSEAGLHQLSAQHLAFVRDHNNFIALDSLIGSGADVTTFLDKATPINGERRSLRKMCNGDVDPPKKRSKRSQSPDSTVNGSQSPRHNGGLEDERKHNTRCSKKSSESQLSEDRQYYKVVGVSTKLRSSGGFMKRKESLPPCNGTKPLVVKFRKVRRSELSELCDEAEQFMFPKRPSSTSSTSSEDEKDDAPLTRRRNSPLPQPTMERRRLARPLALKEESSEEDSWTEDKRRRKRRIAPVAKRSLRVASKTVEPVTEPAPVEPEEPVVENEVSPLREEVTEKCMKWEDGRLKYTPAVEQLEFAFESVPQSEPWFETFKRQDQDKVVMKNVPQYFALYANNAPKLPYEIGQLPPLKPNCCPLSELVKRDDKVTPSRSYGTRGMKRQKVKKRIVQVQALDSHPRKSPREHASTLAIFGSLGKRHTDEKSTASEDTISDTQSNVKVEPVVSETQEASERLQQFLSEVFEDAADYDMSDATVEGEALTTSSNLPDVSSLISECEDCDLIRNEISEQQTTRSKGRRGRFKKKNKTGWPNKKFKKDSRNNSNDREHGSSVQCSSAEPPDNEITQDTISEEDANLSETDKTLVEEKSDDSQDTEDNKTLEKIKSESRKRMDDDEEESKLKVQRDKGRGKRDSDEQRTSRSSTSDTEDKETRRKRRALQGLLLQPVVRVARVPALLPRRLRSAATKETAHR